MIEKSQLRKIIEGALLAYGQPLSLDKLHSLFFTETTENDEGETVASAVQVEKADILAVIEEIEASCEDRGFELKKVASGWRFQVRQETALWVNKLWDEKPQRYSRALMETLAIIAYRQPITRGDIEEIRGVAVSSNIIKTLSEREWVKVIGHRDVPGRPALYATTKIFLDYFNLQSLEQLPSLQELTDIESLMPELNLEAAKAADEQGNEPVDSQTDSEQAQEGELENTDVNMMDEGVDADAQADIATNDDNNETSPDTSEQVVH